MRSLTAGQKKLLTAIMEENEPSAEYKMLGTAVNPIRSVDDLTQRQWEQLEAIHATEILSQEANAFIEKWRWNKINATK